ncbi:MAG: XTP/dITP diphosphatase [Firmicutes bacterium]|nr:XTP/dITP diphosphatase [Bacillota bacterium]
MVLVLATRNEGKVQELKSLLADLPVALKSLKEFPDIPTLAEPGPTFAENALAKARTVAGLTGLPTLADDSGLEVDALGGQPGVYSARYAGEGASDAANNQKLLAALAGVPAGKRTARFRSAVVLTLPDGREFLFTGVCQGEVGFSPRGEDGFGYDPLFRVAGLDRTMAELSLEEKNSISHRALALTKMKEALRGLLEEYAG